MTKLAHALTNPIIDIGMSWHGLTLRPPFLRTAATTRATQHNLLMSILAENAATTFGESHRFAQISNLAEYRANVPIQSYDQLEPLIRNQQTGVTALTREPPVYYARTSGTTGRSKDIPLTEHALKQAKQAQKHLAHTLWRDTRFFKGSILGFASPAIEGHLKNGTPYGSASGSSYRALSPILASKFILPPQTYEISDTEAKYQTYALAVLANADITGVVTANPSSILKVVNTILADKQKLLAALTSGSGAILHPEAAQRLPEIIRRGNPRHIKKLQRQIDATGSLQPHDIWPRLSAIATWTGGSCGVALAQLRPHLPEATQIVEYGYGASEFTGTVNIDAKTNLCLPLLSHHFYEFVRRDKWEADRPEFLGLHEILPDNDYYIFITTRSGLYRYDINDILRAEPGIGSCAGLRFLHKGRGVTNITGEKLSEHQLIAALTHILADLNLTAPSFIALADEHASCYRLYLECPAPYDGADLIARLDAELRALNSEYDDKRAGGRLGPFQLSRLQDGAGEQIKQHSVATGMREAQYKPVLLDYARNWTDRLAPLTEQEAEP